jgi:hypothetical protein
MCFPDFVVVCHCCWREAAAASPLWVLCNNITAEATAASFPGRKEGRVCVNVPLHMLPGGKERATQKETLFMSDKKRIVEVLQMKSEKVKRFEIEKKTRTE